MKEGRGTGIPKILQAIKKNNSPKPIFHTDEDRSYFVVELLLHPAFIKGKEPELRPESSLQNKILRILKRDRRRLSVSIYPYLKPFICKAFRPPSGMP